MNKELLRAFELCALDPSTDEVWMAILVARAMDPSVSPELVEDRLDALSARLPDVTAPWVFLRDAGFAGNVQEYAALDNSNLARVLETRRGIPITLAVLLMRLARRAGYSAVGINFPGHFLVAVDDVLVDPFVMAPVSQEQCLERIEPAMRQLPREQLFAPASTLALGLRMLNNVKLAHVQAAAWDLALDIVDAQLKLAPDQAALHLESGDLWTRLGRVAPARAAFQAAVELAKGVGGAEQIRRIAQSRLDGLGTDDDILH